MGAGFPSPIRLIVNADDFGFTRDVNAGIVEAHRNGILTATTLMANGAAFDDALRLAREAPSLDVGCHVVLVQGNSVLDPARALPATVKDLVRAVVRREIPIYEEIAAQVRRLMCAGIRVSHIDTHKHTHLMPPVLEAVARVAREFGIAWVRRPFDFGVDRRAKVLKAATAVGLRVLRPGFDAALRGLRTTDYFTGFQVTGSLDGRRLVETLEQLPEGLTEFMCHPGRLGAELEHSLTRLKKSREVELAALVSGEVRRAIEARGIELVNYREI
ncbi:MAG: ChbG/HpnK family deacetylase [Acidobacteriota bacterium]|nr:ChbG/HpnK family deacetylase [Acidobacteriota bacterium]